MLSEKKLNNMKTQQISVHKSEIKKNFLGLSITLGSYRSFIEKILTLMKESRSEYICVANVHMLVEASRDKNFAKIVNEATICTPDGMPLAFGLKFLFGILQDRVAGMDLLPDLLREVEIRALPVYFYGGTQEMLDRTKSHLKENFPNLLVGGMYSPPFRPLTAVEEFTMINVINNSGAKIVFVALGCPKQEKWMASMKNKILMPTIGIGGALPVMIGSQKRAPLWMQNASLEWLYRLIQEPRRLFKRYAITNTIFIWLLLRQKVSMLRAKPF